MTEEVEIDLEAPATFTIYDPETGAIKRSGYCRQGDLEIQVCPGEAAIFNQSGNDVTQYVLDGVIVDRPAFTISKTAIAADDTDEAVITGLPDPVWVVIDGHPFEVTGGTLSVSSPMPATYHIGIDHWPYMPFDTEVVVS
ncbi:hypothetical protein B9J07_28310 [Sinorhizobium sp. LM21]|uniref:hypothetical protein n=1 Tax=Sinorhizobium sp. LM21 TaxID=1449788 RepID=UPI0005D82566|nr:hypothetical protein [Sinorhizobium sp. LM21]AJW30255.1 hypothetical protein pLM21S1_p137 [Sinorhizobium sp. LM21]OWZ90492.1 hypothetical protein B9J07_28310 [Sinorhizobium sp. LM21]